MAALASENDKKTVGSLGPEGGEGGGVLSCDGRRRRRRGHLLDARVRRDSLVVVGAAFSTPFKTKRGEKTTTRHDTTHALNNDASFVRGDGFTFISAHGRV